MTAATQAAEVSDDILKWEGLPCPGDCFSCPPMWEEPLCSDCPENRRVAPPPTLTTSSGPNVGGAAGLRLPGKSAGGTASHVDYFFWPQCGRSRWAPTARKIGGWHRLPR